MGLTFDRDVEDRGGAGGKEGVGGTHMGGEGAKDPEVFNKPDPGSRNHRQAD